MGTVAGREPGPTLLVMTALHGNEPAGMLGAERVLEELEAAGGLPRGDFLAVVGNREAVSRGIRFQDLDLNRAWLSPRLRALQRGRLPRPPRLEDREQSEILKVLDEAERRARGAITVLDLHTTSGPGAAWSTTGDTLQNRTLALSLPVPLVLGLEEQVEGTLLEYLDERGWANLVVECGQHQDPRSPDRAEAVIWLALEATGLLGAGFLPRVRRARELLATERRGDRRPRVAEMRYRHPVEVGDGFQMEPGYSNFQPVAEGQLLAHDRRGPVTAPHAGRLLMPLYQSLGSDGYFLIRRVRPVWLRLSAFLRRWELSGLLPWLPGVHRTREGSEILVVDRGVARWLALEFFHLLGFRKVRERGRLLVLTRRAQDRKAGPGSSESQPQGLASK